ncbi:MAG TPA: PKD domain-containing protein, partial [bacterium]|nr:PKD domain-containing protein [bacterium]
MRIASMWLAGSVALLALGCSGGGSAPTAPAGGDGNPTPLPSGLSSLSPGTAALGGTVARPGGSESAMAIFQVEVDTDALSATAHLKEVRTAQETDDIYLLDISAFTTPTTFSVSSIAADATSVTVNYTITHPFKAPSNLDGPATAANRADLGISGRVLFLNDVPSATGNTYFQGDGDIIANSTLMLSPDGYYTPAGLLDTTGFTANTFPYNVLVDETADPRTSSATGAPISNGGSDRGNYDPSTGWQRSNIGPNNDGWTGFGVQHQGQAASNAFVVDRNELATSTFSLDVAIIAKYEDPRGGTTGTQKKANRLPANPADVARFVYREPHGALDVERVRFVSESGGFIPNQVSASTLSFRVVDWDARATETSQADLFDETDPTLVAQGESGAPALSVSIPGVLGTAPVDLTEGPDDDDTADGGDAGQDSGEPGDPLYYSEAVTKTVTSGQTAGDYTGMVRAEDPEVALDTSEWYFPLDGSSTPPTPLSSNLPEPIAYAAFSVTMGVACENPVATAVSPSGNAGCTGATVTFNVTGNTGDTPTGWSWNFGGGATPNTSSNSAPMVTLGAPGTYNGTVTLSSACGTGADFPFSFTVSSAWTEYNPDDNHPQGQGGHFPSPLIFNGNPVVFTTSYSNSTITPVTPYQIRVSIATVPNPTSPAQWVSHDITSYPASATTSATDTYISPVVTGGRLAVAYKEDVSNNLRIALANVVTPTSSTDWTTYSIDTINAANTHPWFSMVSHNGGLAISFRAGALPNNLRLSRTSVALPASSADWTTHTVDTAVDGGFWSELLSYSTPGGPRLAVAYYDNTNVDLRFTRSTVANPAASADWITPITIDGALGWGYHSAMARVSVGGADRFALAGYEFATPANLRIVYSTTDAPTTAADFGPAVVIPTASCRRAGTSRTPEPSTSPSAHAPAPRSPQYAVSKSHSVSCSNRSLGEGAPS